MNQIAPGLSNLPSFLMTVLVNPSLNPRVAFLLYASIGLLILLVMVVLIILLMRPVRDDSPEEQDVEDGTEFEQLAAGEVFEGLDEPVAPKRRTAPRRAKTPAPPLSLRTRLVIAGVVVIVATGVIALTGYTTSDPAVCKGCHWPASQHAKATAGSDPHAEVACVACHEPGGVLGRYVTGGLARLVHFADSESPFGPQIEYGSVTVSACSTCHRAAITGVATNKTRGLKVSHKEPLAASATCIDCHALRGGVVGTHNAGMNPCLRCHDAKHASAECSTCHDEKATAAARVRTTSFSDVQIAEVECGGCHDEKQECDPCHGLRMPHSREFRAYAHSRAGAVDFWYNGGKGCARCHTASRRPCQKCHTAILGKAHGEGMNWLPRGHQTAVTTACNTCHGQWAYVANRDFCRDICHAPAARANSSR